MRRHHHCRAGFERLLDCRQRGPDARVVGDGRGVVLRYVQVGADENAFAAEVELRHALELHYFAVATSAPTSAKAAATSSIRLEKPHSLSYQEHTFTSVPSETRVMVESKIE